MTQSRAPDVVVVGAGVIGCSIALELARGGRRVLVVDAGPAAGAGTTSASSSIVRFHYSTQAGVLTAWEAAGRWERWADHLETLDPDGLARFVKTGCLVLDPPANNRAAVLAQFDHVDVPYEEWDADTIRQRVPALDPAQHWPPKPLDHPTFGDDAVGELGGYFTPDAGFVDDPMLAAHNLMVAAKAAGAVFRFKAKVVDVPIRDHRVAGVVLASGERLEAPIVVNAAGPFSSELNRLAGVETDMRITTRPLRQEVDVVAAPTGFGIDAAGVVVTDADLGIYFRPQPGDTVLVGGMEPECDPLVWVDDPWRFEDRITVETWEAQVLRLAQRIPELGIPLRPVGLAAMYDVTEDWTPIYDRSALAGFYLACGTSGNQFKNAPMVGTFLAALVDACESGHDHDRDPVMVVGERTGQEIDLAQFSRRREPANTTGSVLG